jgi:hypothetical protein
MFQAQVSDQQDLDRLEFWVNDTLIEVKHPSSPLVKRLETAHVWSSRQPGQYNLSLIAYDQAGQTSLRVKFQVSVQAP